jgi:hypothetical protein
MDIELKQVSLAATTEYNKKGKCVELERFEREQGYVTGKETKEGVSTFTV